MIAWLELKILPPIVALIIAALMWLLPIELGLINYEIYYKHVICILLVGVGLLIDLNAIWCFKQAKTTVNPVKPNNASTLVTTGIYQYTRNPMYLGNLIFLSTWLLWLGSPYNVLFLYLYVVYMNKFQIIPEERVLEKIFGDSYTGFCCHVRRWI